MNKTKKTKPSKINYIKLSAFILIIVIIIIVSHIPQVRDTLSFSKLHGLADSATEVAHRPYGPPLFVMVSAAAPLLHMPEIVVVVLGGMVYGFWLAFFLTWAGCGLGTTCTFLISRFFLQDYFKPKLETSILQKFNERFEKDGIITMCFLRMILFLFPPLNWLIGATGIKTRDYIIGNLLGITPWLLGVLLAVKKIEQINSLADILQPESIALVLTFIGIFLIVVYVRKKYFFSVTKGAGDD